MAVCTNGYQGLKPGLVTGVTGIRRGLRTVSVHGPTGAIGTCTQQRGGRGCGLGAGIGTAGSTNREHLCTNGAARRLFGHQELMCGRGMVPSGNMVSPTHIGAVLFPRGSGPDGNGFLAHSCMNLALGNGIMSEGAGRLTAVVGYGYGTDHGGKWLQPVGCMGIWLRSDMFGWKWTEVWGWHYESGWWHLIYVTDHCPTAGTGDMNADDTLDVLDLVAIVYGIVEQTFEEGSCEMKTADSNEDGDVNVIDLVEYVGVIIA